MRDEGVAARPVGIPKLPPWLNDRRCSACMVRERTCQRSMTTSLQGAPDLEGVGA